MALTADRIREIVAAHRDQTDDPDGIAVVADWFRQALEGTASEWGEAALEIGVRSGGTSAILCEMAEEFGLTGFAVLSVDPYGNIPLYSPSLSGNTYGEDHYVTAKRVLAQYPRSALFRMTADEFIHSVLPVHRWWFGGLVFPAKRRYLSFVYLDGQHDHPSVVSEVEALVPFMAPRGIIAIDNTESVPGAIEALAGSPRLGLGRRLHWENTPGGRNHSPHTRDGFEVP